MQVDAALAPKRAAIFGTQYAAPATILQSLADLYGLRVRKADDGTLLLTRREFQIPLPWDALRPMLLPDPLMRAMGYDIHRQMFPFPTHAEDSPSRRPHPARCRYAIPPPANFGRSPSRR